MLKAITFSLYVEFIFGIQHWSHSQTLRLVRLARMEFFDTCLLGETQMNYGKNEEEIKKEDKLKNRTKKLIRKREELSWKPRKNHWEKIELVELYKLTRKMRYDIKVYNQQAINKIIEKNL